MQIRQLSIDGAWEFTPVVHRDDRGQFLEAYRFEPLVEVLGDAPLWKQSNISVSARGVVRGIHFSTADPGQAKYVTAVRGRVIDFVIDVREGSPTFGKWDAVELDSASPRAVYIAGGLGHAFVALDDDATINYLCTEVYDPIAESAVHALDPAIGLEFPFPAAELRLSARDEVAPTLAEARDAGRLSRWKEAVR